MKILNRLKKIFQFLRRISSTKRPFKLTRPGWVFILYTIGVGAGAINTGNNLLYILFGLFLGLMMASGLLSDLSLWNLSLTIDLPNEGRREQPVIIPFTVENLKKKFPSLSFRVECDASINSQSVNLKAFCQSVDATKIYKGQFIFQPRQRGWLQINLTRFSTIFPFGLLMKWWTHQRFDKGECGIFITPSRHHWTLPRDFLNGLGVQFPIQAGIKGEGSSLFGIRKFNSTDNPRRIHWKASAKRLREGDSVEDSWVVREMELDKSPEVFFELPELRQLINQPADERETWAQKVYSLHSSLMEKRVPNHFFISIDGKLEHIHSIGKFLAIFDSPDFVQFKSILFSRAPASELRLIQIDDVLSLLRPI